VKGRSSNSLSDILGGTLSDRFVHAWGNLRRARVAVSVGGFAIAGTGLVVLPESATSSTAVSVFLTLFLAGLERTVAGSWATALDLGGIHSGSVSALMNTLGNLGGALSGICFAYIATHYGWVWVADEVGTVSAETRYQ